MSIDEQPVQRLRVLYAKDEPLRFASHLDMMRLWERAMRRAGLPVAHSQGFNPRPRMVMAAPLPTGVTSRAELLDVFLTEPLDPGEALCRLNETLPPGSRVLRMWEVPLKGPALMALAGSVEYECRVRRGGTSDELAAQLATWMDQKTAVRQRQRKSRSDTYDLRPLVERVWLAGQEGEESVICMRLRAAPEGTGRPDELLKALDLWDDARGVERTALLLPDIS